MLYEMLTGRKAFEAPTPAGLIARILYSSRVTAAPNGLLPRQFDITLPEGTILRSGLVPDRPQISPNGLWVVHGANVQGRRQLHLRSLTTPALKVLLENEDASFPFWSPDSRTIGFFSDGKLKTLTYPQPGLRRASLSRRDVRMVADGTGLWSGLAAEYLLVKRDGWMRAIRFDAGVGQLLGSEIPIGEGIDAASGSHDGTIVFHAPQDRGRNQLTWFDRKGVRESAPGLESDAAWSPDGRKVAFTSARSGPMAVYVKDVETGKETRSVSLVTTPELAVQRPVKLFATNIDPSPNFSQFGVTPDGQRFLGLDRGEPQREVFTVLLNWLTPENLARRQP